MVSRLRHTKAGPLDAGNAARRSVRRVVGVGMGLPRHDGKAEGALLMLVCICKQRKMRDL